MPHTKPLREQRRRKVLLALLYAGIGILLVGIVMAVVAILGLTNAIRENQKTGRTINTTILDCTKPDGECAKRNQERIAGAVNNIGRLSVYASACAADVDPQLPVEERVAVIQRCVMKLVEDNDTQSGGVG